jgi:hypothetical protein
MGLLTVLPLFQPNIATNPGYLCFLKGNLTVKFKRDIRHAFSGWKITNARLAGKYLCTAVNLDSLDLGLHFLDLSEEQTQSSFTSRKRKRDLL